MAVSVFLLYLFVPVLSRDDAWFTTVFHHHYNGELLPFLDFRYHTWSTRLILEALTLLLAEFPLLYRLSMPLWTAAIALGIQRIAGGLERRSQWMLCLGMLLLSPMPFSRAGYVCSTVNYIFTLACFLWAVEPVFQTLRGNSVPLWRRLLSPVLMLLACNMEYYCPPALVTVLVLTGLSVKRRKNPTLPLVLLLTVAASIAFVAAAPVSTAAGYAQTDTIFPGYEALGAGEKLLAGFVSTAGGLLSTYHHGDSLLIAALTVGALLALWGWERERRLWRWLYALPLALPLATGCAARISPEGSLWRILFLDSESGWLWNHPAALALALVYFASLLLCLWRFRRGLALWAALALCCRVLMGFSRSVFESGLRTFAPLALLFCAAGALLAGEMQHRRAAWGILLCGVGATGLWFFFFLFSGAGNAF